MRGDPIANSASLVVKLNFGERRPWAVENSNHTGDGADATSPTAAPVSAFPAGAEAPGAKV